ncbi:hypothetical protein BHM03_00051192 [Ensete ventricosum]|nr:hypothetical protein BHM03_00051192 [Ensete ventricosum]
MYLLVACIIEMQELNIREFSFHQLNANLLWPGTFAFSNWLVQNQSLLHGARILELGSDILLYVKQYPSLIKTLCVLLLNSSGRNKDTKAKAAAALSVSGTTTGRRTSSLFISCCCCCCCLLWLSFLICQRKTRRGASDAASFRHELAAQARGRGDAFFHGLQGCWSYRTRSGVSRLLHQPRLEEEERNRETFPRPPLNSRCIDRFKRFRIIFY